VPSDTQVIPSDYAPDHEGPHLVISVVGFDYVVTVAGDRLDEGVVFATSGTRSVNRMSMVAALFKLERADPKERDLESCCSLLRSVIHDVEARLGAGEGDGDA